MPDRQTAPQLQPRPLPPLDPDPLVSVLVANYNYARYLPECLRSVLAQTYQTFEILVCDDGSRDESLKVLEQLAASDPRISILPQENGGQASALNRAYDASRGAIVTILDADDTLHRQKLAQTVQAFRANPTAGLATHRLSIIDSDGCLVGRPPIPSRLDSGNVAPLMLRHGLSCMLPPATGLSLRREVAAEVFPIPVGFVQIADGFVARAAALITDVAGDPAVLASYRIHASNLTGIHAFSVDSLAKQIHLMEQLCTEVCGWLRRQTGIALVLEDMLQQNSAYLENALALHVMTTASSSRDPRFLHAVLQGPSSPPRKAMWRVLFAFESNLASRVLFHWWGPSTAKAVVHRVLSRFGRNGQTATAA